MSEAEMDKAMVVNLLGTARNERARILELQWNVSVLVKAAFDAGATWKEIGEALGVSTQSAWKQYHPEPSQKIIPGQGPYQIEHNE